MTSGTTQIVETQVVPAVILPVFIKTNLTADGTKIIISNDLKAIKKIDINVDIAIAAIKT